MAIQQVPFNPYGTTNAAGSFSVQSAGWVQGVYQDDPAIRNALATGTLSASATLPLWGGVPISESIAAASADNTLGGSIIQAASVANITGWSVFNNAYSMVGSPTSPVPLAVNAGASVAFFRSGCGIRIPVAMDPSLVSLDGNLITQNVSWDFNNQVLQPYDASTSTYSITSMTPTYNSTTGVWTIAVVAAGSNVGAVGDFINISGATNTGTGGAALVNGNFVVTAYTSATNFSFQITASSGAIGTIAGTALLNYGTGLLPVKVLAINPGNSMTVSYNATTGAATWNRQGFAALIQI
jgi:hypothetical protein